MASNLAGAAGQRAMNTQYQSQNFGNQFQAPQNYQTGQFNAQQVNAPQLQNYKMGPDTFFIKKIIKFFYVIKF
jgi:hypothetical protein